MNEIKRHLHKIDTTVGSTIFDHALIKPNDRVLIGVSGGKDSLTLLDTLARWKRRVPITAELFAAHITVSEFPDGIDSLYLDDFCRSRGVPFKSITTSAGIVDLTKDNPCFICARHRRNALFEYAREINCSRLALGHHLDDIIATLLMNMCYHGNISSMPLSSTLFKGNLTIIRPLGAIEESDIILYERQQKLGAQKSTCTHGKLLSRSRIREVIDDLAADNPTVKKNIFRSRWNIKNEYL